MMICRLRKICVFHQRDGFTVCTFEVEAPVSNFMMRILHLLLPLLPLLLHVAAEEGHEEDYGGDAQDAYADSQESDEKREEEKLKAKKKEEELEQIGEKHGKKFLDILSYIQSKEQEMEGAVRKGHKEFQDFLSKISGLIRDKKYMDFSVPKKVNIEQKFTLNTHKSFIQFLHFRPMRRHQLLVSSIRRKNQFNEKYNHSYNTTTDMNPALSCILKRFYQVWIKVHFPCFKAR